MNNEVQYEIVKRKDTIIKIDSTNKNANWFHFMKTCFTSGWEEETFNIIDRFADKNKVLIDIGSWVGPISLYYADKYRRVFAIDADKESIKVLKQNIVLNNFHNVLVIDNAIYSENKRIYFGPNEYYHTKEMNISVSQSRESKLYDCDYEVDGITFDELIKRYQIDNDNNNNNNNNNNIGMIKCDIEGGEENIINDVLTYGYNYHVPIWMSFHIDWWKNHKLEDFTDIFGLFCDSDIDSEILINDIKNNPLKSILFSTMCDINYQYNDIPRKKAEL